MFAKVLVATALLASTRAAAVFGDGSVTSLQKQTCSTGCVAGLMVMAGFVLCIACFAMCCFFWPAPELNSRIERRAIAKKRLHEREEERAQQKRDNEEIEESEEEEEPAHQSRGAGSASNGDEDSLDEL